MAVFHNKTIAGEVAIDSCPIINGVENANPAILIAQTRAQEMTNRLAIIDSRNRCRPGITRQINSANPMVGGGYYNGGLYLFTDGVNLYTYNNVTKTLTQVFASVPFVAGPGSANINGCQGGGSSGSVPVFFFNQGAGLYYWDGTNWNTVSMPTASPNMSFPVWQANRLMAARTGTNDVSVADIGTVPPNFGPGNNDLTVRVTLDSEGSDSINGMAGFQANILIAAKRAKIYAIVTDDTISVANWSKQPVSKTIGVAEHNTMAMAGNNLLFLSESGNGVYAIALQPGTSIPGISAKTSDRITPDIQRINWAAVSTARAVNWQDLYLLAVPLDGATTPNALLVYSVSLDEWQGIWTATNDVTGLSSAIWRMFAYNPSASAGSELLIGFQNGDIGMQTKPITAQYFDMTVGAAQIPINSSVLSRGFHWDGTIIPPTEGGQPYNTQFLNKVQPYNARLRFSQSNAPINVDVLTDQSTNIGFKQNLKTSVKNLQLPHNLPWNLDSEGDAYQSINIQAPTQSCTEVQLNLYGTGDWRLHKMDVTAFIDRTATNT